MGKIILARHGECLDNQLRVFNGTLDSVLSRNGVTQARDLARALRTNFNVGHIFCSPKQRAVETAEICRVQCGFARVVVLDYLLERSHGILEGRPHSQVRLFADRWVHHEGFDYILEAQGAETYPELYQRAKLVYTNMMEEVAGFPDWHKDVLFVGHGALFKMVEAVHYGRPWESIWQNPWWRNCEYRLLE